MIKLGTISLISGNPTPNVAKGVEVEVKSGEQKISNSPKQLSPCSDEPSPKHNRNVSADGLFISSCLKLVSLRSCNYLTLQKTTF